MCRGEPVTEPPRARLALAEALKRRLESTQLRKVTVAGLSAEAGVHRQTFYSHFRDVYDLTRWVFAFEAADDILAHTGQDEWADGLLQLLIYMREHQEQADSVITSMRLRDLERFLFATFRQMTTAVVTQVQGELILRPEDRDLVIDHYTISVVGHITHWIASDMAEEPYQLVSSLEFLLADSVRRSLERCAASLRPDGSVHRSAVHPRRRSL